MLKQQLLLTVAELAKSLGIAMFTNVLATLATHAYETKLVHRGSPLLETMEGQRIPRDVLQPVWAGGLVDVCRAALCSSGRTV